MMAFLVSVFAWEGKREKIDSANGVLNMDLPYWIAIFLIGSIGSFISGMVGIGGSIIKYPMLLYIPPFLGFAAFTAHEVSGISAIQVSLLLLLGFGRTERVNI